MLLRANALAKGYSGAHVETVELLIECLNRGVLPRVPARGSVGASGDLAPLAHLALPLVGEGRRLVCGDALRRRRGARRGWAATDQAGGEGRAVADQRHPVHGLDGRARARARPAARAHRRPRVRALARVAAGLAHELSPRDPPARPLRGQIDSAANVLRLLEGRRSSSRIAGATRCRTPTRCDARRRCTEPAATCSTTSRPRRRRAERRHRQPARARRRRPRRLERKLSRPAAGLRARHAGDGGVRAGEHLGAARRAARQPSLSEGLPPFSPSRAASTRAS